ncbi:periplasmic chaperone for outer membrane proteins SurA [Rhizorhabdus histidinilytica]|uniref:Parvulin-like PPIase n=2 Tax=Rhizorhabdus histidinilytica TaxID=439228 RepID=A0A1T5F219_9SPHN|nr:periplasmic chaperone for outer membrane proteins SurA [Rhizorhabdus histidinilytica]
MRGLMLRRGGFWMTAAAVGAIALATPIIAQTMMDDEDVGGLNIPKDITVFGNRDPNIRTATAIVNGTIITQTDVEQRLALVIAANGGNIPDEERERLRLQVLRNLIDETLQIQEATAQKVEVSPEEVQQTYDRVAANFRKSPKEFAEFLREKGSSQASIKRQIEGEAAWRRVLSRKVEPFVAVSDEEVNAIIARLKASKGANEYHVGEIFLSATPETMNEASANAERIIDQVRRGASFAAYARQFSEASTAAVGGDLGWVRAEQLPDQLASVVNQLQPGQISQPIAIPGGYSILLLSDKRQVLGADPRDAQLLLKQLTVNFPPGITQAQATPKVEAFAKALEQIKGCGNANEVAANIGAEVVNNDQMKIRDLPPQLQEVMLNLQIGQSTPPFGSLRDGIRALILCGRDDPTPSSGPSFEQIQSQIEQERVNRRAQRYLRDLRRDAVIEYR